MSPSQTEPLEFKADEFSGAITRLAMGANGWEIGGWIVPSLELVSQELTITITWGDREISSCAVGSEPDKHGRFCFLGLISRNPGENVGSRHLGIVVRSKGGREAAVRLRNRLITMDYSGSIDRAEEGLVSGWARDDRFPNKSVQIRLVSSGGEERRLEANGPRPDLVSDTDSGLHGFDVRMEAPAWCMLCNDGGEVIAVVSRSVDGSGGSATRGATLHIQHNVAVRDGWHVMTGYVQDPDGHESRLRFLLHGRCEAPVLRPCKPGRDLPKGIAGGFQADSMIWQFVYATKIDNGVSPDPVPESSADWAATSLSGIPELTIRGPVVPDASVSALIEMLEAVPVWMLPEALVGVYGTAGADSPAFRKRARPSRGEPVAHVESISPKAPRLIAPVVVKGGRISGEFAIESPGESPEVRVTLGDLELASSEDTDVLKVTVDQHGKLRFEAVVDPEEASRCSSQQPILIRMNGVVAHAIDHMPLPNIVFHVDACRQGYVAGWGYDSNNPTYCLELEITNYGTPIGTIVADMVREDVKDSGHPSSRCGFHFELPDEVYGTAMEVNFRLVGSGRPILAKPLTYIARSQAKEELSKALSSLIRRTELPAWASHSLRKAISASFPSILDAIKADPLPASPGTPQAVTVIIPVYLGLMETKRCIDSVMSDMESNGGGSLLVINDCSPDPRMKVLLEGYRETAKVRFVLIHNRENLGFVGTVNLGMTLAGRSDVVLLNSDTIVPEGWLGRLQACALSESDIGTVTPFSNNATILSYPRFCADNPWNPRWKLERIDNAFRRATEEAGLGWIDLPSAHGFCMYIKRRALDEVGLFNVAAFKRGYGEENDFSVRASNLGWRNVACVNLFVRHEGSVSFSKDKDSYLAENLKTLYAIHPEYSGSVESFLRRDPLRLVRRRAGQILIREYISERFSSCVLFVCHDFGGGTLRAMDDLEARMADEGVAVVRLSRIASGTWVVRVEGEDILSEFSRAERDELVEYLKTLKLIFAHVHSGIATGPELAEVIEEIGIKTIYSIHDYAWYCPRITMIGETGTYCGDPGLDGCRSCMKAVGPSPAILNDPVDPSVDIVRWREAWRVRLLKADGIFAPSRDAAARISRWLGREVQFKPHWEKPARIQVARASSRDGEVNVCFIGAIGMHKGFRELREMAEIARVENPHVRFHVIGYTCADEQLKSYPNITIWGKYKKSELSAMLRECHGDVAAFFSPWPETFCYTLSEAVEAGLRPIAYDIGAFRERIPKIGGGRLVALGTPSNQLLGAILELANSSIPIPATDAIDYGSIMKDYYGIYSPSEAPCTGRNQ